MPEEKSDSVYAAPVKRAVKAEKEKTMAEGHVAGTNRLDATQPLTQTQMAMLAAGSDTARSTVPPTEGSVANYYPGKYQKHETLPEEEPETKKTYVVQPNESIGGIAKKFGVTREALMAANPDEVHGTTKKYFFANRTIVIPEKEPATEEKPQKTTAETEIKEPTQEISEAKAEEIVEKQTDKPAQEESKVLESEKNNVAKASSSGQKQHNLSGLQSERKPEVADKKSVVETSDFRVDSNQVTNDLKLESAKRIEGESIQAIPNQTMLYASVRNEVSGVESKSSDTGLDRKILRGAFKNGISGSVGEGGDNFYLDVICVAKALVKNKYKVPESALVKGECSKELIDVIKSYQKKELGKTAPDGRVDASSVLEKANGSKKLGGTWNSLNSSTGKYSSGLTNIYGENQWALTNRLKKSSKILNGDVGADLTKNKAENYPEDVKKVARALQELEISVPKTSLENGLSSNDFIKAIKKFQTKKSLTADGNISSGFSAERALFPEEIKSYSIGKLSRKKLSGGKHKFETSNLQERSHYMETVDKLGEGIGLKEGSDEAKVIAMAEKAATDQVYFDSLTKEVPFKVNYARKKAADNTLNPILERRMMRFHKFLVVAGFFRGNMEIGENGAVRDPKVAHKWAVEHYVVTNKTTKTIKENLLKMYNDSSLTTPDNSLLKDMDGFDWAKKSYFKVKNGKAIDVDMAKVKAYVNLKNYRTNKTKAAAEGYKHNNKRRYPLSLTARPNRSNHIEGNAIDINSKYFINRNDAIIDLISLKFGIFRCAGGEQWHFECTNVALDEADIEQHLHGAEINSSPNSSINEITSNKDKEAIQNEEKADLKANASVKNEVKKEVVKTGVKKKQNEQPSVKSDGIIESVGDGGKNKERDVKFVAVRLQALGYLGESEALTLGECDKAFIQAIKDFQQKNFDSFEPDGLISSNKLTIKKIISLYGELKSSAKTKVTSDDLLRKHGDNLEALGKELAGYVRSNSELVKKAIVDIGYWSRDNLSVVISENLSDNDLKVADKSLVKILHDEIYDISIKFKYASWLINPAIGALLSASNRRDFRQIKRLDKILTNVEGKGGKETTKKNVSNDWTDYISESDKKVKDEEVIKAIITNRKAVKNHSDKLRATGKGYIYGGDKKGMPSTSKANKAQVAVWEELAGEGGYESINTWDGEIFTWGKGFAAGGQLPAVLEKLMGDASMKQKFQNVGITQINKVIYVVDEKNGEILEGTAGYKHIAASPKLLHFFIELGKDKDDRQKIVDAQYEVVMSKAGKIPDFVIDTAKNEYKGGWDDSAVKLASHLSHWLPAGGWNLGKSFYKSSDGDILKIVQAFCLTLQKKTRIVNLKNERYIWEVLKYTAVVHLDHKITAGGIGMKAVKKECPAAIDANVAKTDDKYKNHILLPVEGAKKYFTIKKTI